MPGTAQHLDAVDRAIEAEADSAFGFLERLVRAPSTVGEEAAAQEVVAEELDRLGFAVSRVPVPERTAAHPAAGVPQCSYAGRDNVVGRLNPGQSCNRTNMVDEWAQRRVFVECRCGEPNGAGIG